MKILSLFDGMSCGRIALDRAGIPVTQYYASEIDKYAIKVAQANYPDTVQLGDVTKWREWDIDWSSIDLLIGGSPCQGFSFAGKRMAFDDPRSKLFFFYVDILNHIRKLNPDIKFMLENVKMKREWLDTISGFLGVEPVCINSSLVSAQNRQRYYWANWDLSQPDDCGILLNDIIEQGVQGKIVSAKSAQKYAPSGEAYVDPYNKKPILCGKSTTLRLNVSNGNMWVRQSIHENYGGKPVYRQLTPIECERLQTVPEEYTASVSDTQRKRVLGNGWTVDVIAHLFNSL